jgi:hypothetical protein
MSPKQLETAKKIYLPLLPAPKSPQIALLLVLPKAYVFPSSSEPNKSSYSKINQCWFLLFAMRNPK